MNKKRFAEAMNMVDEKFYAEAANYQCRKKKPVWVKWGALAACLCFAIVGIVYFMSPLKVNIIASNDRYSLADSVNSLQDVSDLIVIAHAESAGKNAFIRGESGEIIFGYTDTTISVDTVFKGNIENNSSVEITEECYTTALGTVLWTQQGYLPIRAGTEYILFLKAYPEDSKYAGKYFPVDLEYGKYIYSSSPDVDNIGTSSIDRTKLEVGSATDLSKYLEWYREVLYNYCAEAKDTSEITAPLEDTAYRVTLTVQK